MTDILQETQARQVKLYSPDTSEAIMRAIESAMLANNGYSDIGNTDEDVREGVRAAGFDVVAGRNLHGGNTWFAARPGAIKSANSEAAQYKKHTNPCPKCHGNGKLYEYRHVSGGVCFACNGTGVAS